MTSLSDRKIKNTYGDLLQVSNSNSGIDATLRNLEDGEGTVGPVQLSVDAVQVPVSKTFTVGGTFDFNGASVLTGTWPVANGGTGASTAAGARTNLSAQQQSQILDDLTTAAAGDGVLDFLGAPFSKDEAITSSFTATAAQSGTVFRVNTTGGAITMTLPPASGNQGVTYGVYISAGTNALTIDPNGSETINGSVSAGINSVADSGFIYCTGAAWIFFETRTLLARNNTWGGLNTFNDDVTIRDVDPSQSAGPSLNIQRLSPSPAPNDILAQIDWWGYNTANPQEAVVYARIRGILESPTDGSEEARLEILTMFDGDPSVRWRINRGIYSPSATGQDKGQGTVNVEGGVYRNNVEYTRGWTYTSAVNTTSGAALTIATGIPSDVTEIDVIFNQVSLSADADVLLRLGDSGGFETTGYVSSAANIISNDIGAGQVTTGLNITRPNAQSGAERVSGTYRLVRWNPTQHLWMGSGVMLMNNPITSFFHLASGTKTLSASLDRLQLRSTGATATFDNGQVRVRYR